MFGLCGINNLNECSEEESCPAAGADDIKPDQFEPLVRDVSQRTGQMVTEDVLTKRSMSTDDENIETTRGQHRLDN